MVQFRRLLSILLVPLFILTASAPLVSAQASKTGNGISISPTRSDLKITPGDGTALRVTIKNVSGGDITAVPVVNDFESDGVTGNPKIIINPKETPKTSIAQFLPKLENIQLKKDEQRTITVDVKVPSGTSAGAYYGVLRFDIIPVGATTPKQDQVALQASVGTLILIEVPGNVTESMQVVSIKAALKGKEGTFFTAKPDQINTLIKNTGNGFAQPVGKVTVKGMFNKAYSYELNNGNPRGNILPGSSRLFKDALKGVGMPGRYSITANLAYGEGREVTTIKSSFWYMPVWATIVLILIILAILAAIIVLYRKMQGNISRN